MVIWSEVARQDLQAIFHFIARDSAHYARKVVEEIGRIVSEPGIETVRELLVYSYRLIYEIAEDGVVILTIVHQRRHLEPEDSERPPTTRRGDY